MANTRGVATVRERLEGLVYGVPWVISEDDAGLLDKYEGVEDGLSPVSTIGSNRSSDRRSPATRTQQSVDRR
jgi:hypothetical protein